MRLMGIDPGLRVSGWGIIEMDPYGKFSMTACGMIQGDPKPLTLCLNRVFDGLIEVCQKYRPETAAVEDSFVNQNPKSSLNLGLAKGAALLACTRVGIPVTEYSATLIKQTVVGFGKASKHQVQAMVNVWIPDAAWRSEHDCDALAVAICHSHHLRDRYRSSEP